MNETVLISMADSLWQAQTGGVAIPPLRDAAEKQSLDASAANAYAIQRINRDRRLRAGGRIVGRKIGLTSRAVQKQLGVDSPDYGNLWADGSFGDGAEVRLSHFIQPKIEAEVALVLCRDLDVPDASAADLIRATDFALASLEIVDSRIADWRISLFDTIADNASGAAFVLGGDPVRLDRVALRDAAMSLTCNGQPASQGIGSACLGHPINAAAWLARVLSRQGDPLRAGDILLTGALGPMVPARAGDRFEATIQGLGSVSVHFT